MKISYNWLKDYLRGNIPRPEKLKEVFNLHIFEVESLEKRGRDYIFDLDILPNRGPDCLSMVGISRELSAILPLKLIPLQKGSISKIKKEKKRIQFEVENKEDCSAYLGLIVRGVRVKESPKGIRERLEKLGVNSINNVVDILNYVMLETGQPLHAFDLEKIEGGRIIVRRAKNKEKIKTLDGKEFSLAKDVLLIADKKGPLAIAGIKGGKRAEITKETKEILIESANFNPLTIRKSRQKIGIQTDASLRFEHNVPIYFTREGIERVIFLFKKYKVGKEFFLAINYSSGKDSTKRVRLTFEKLEKLSGVKFNKKEVENILRKLGFKIISSNQKEIFVETPLWRKDISLPEDLIEETGRVKGYDIIPSVFPRGEISLPERSESVYWENVLKDYLNYFSFTEVYNYSFIGEEDVQNFGFKNLIEISNPLSAKQKYLRPCLLPNLLKNVRENLKYFSEFKIFEIGKVYFKDKKGKIKEEKRLSGVLVRRNGKAQELFFELKGIIDSLLESLGITDLWYDDFQPILSGNLKSAWNKDSSADIKIGNELVGSLGVISPSFLKKLEIKAEVCVFDFNFDKLQKIIIGEKEYTPISPYPEVIRDISILVPLETKVVELLNVINEVGGKLVRDVDLFDMYEGENLPEGKKSLAFHIVYQAEDRTLTSEEVDEIHQKIIKALEKNPSWEVRK